jgi:hypothetical protein
MHLDAARLIIYGIAALISAAGMVRMTFLLRASRGGPKRAGRKAATIAIVAFSIALVCSLGLLLAGLSGG